MTNLFSAIADDYRIYSAYCRAKEIRPQDEKSFYETDEWKDIQELPNSELIKILGKD